MVLSGIPGVNHDAVKYVQRALLPDHTDAEATAVFTRWEKKNLNANMIFNIQYIQSDSNLDLNLQPMWTPVDSPS